MQEAYNLTLMPTRVLWLRMVGYRPPAENAAAPEPIRQPEDAVSAGWDDEFF